MSGHGEIAQLNKKRKQPLTEKQELALKNLISTNFVDVKQAFLDAGYSPLNVYVAIKALREEIIQLAEGMLVMSAPRAAYTIAEIMTSEDPIAQANTKMDAAKTILDRIGLGKKDQLDVKHDVSGGIMILPAKSEE
jgi:hypothetical protein